MEYLILGFFTGLSLILAIGAQNIFVIEQGLKKQHIFLVCLVCSISDLLLIFFGIYLFYFFQQYFNIFLELTLNILLILFLIYFIYSKIKSFRINISFDSNKSEISSLEIFFKTLGFTYLNPHVYSDTVFFLGNFSKNFLIKEKIFLELVPQLHLLFSFLLLVIYLNIYQNTLKIRKYGNILIYLLFASCHYLQFI